MAAVVATWTNLADLATLMQNAVPNTFKAVEIPDDGDYSGQIVAYDDDDNICLSIASKTSITLHFRDGTNSAVYGPNIAKIAVCANGVMLCKTDGTHTTIAKDHRGKIAFTNNQNGDAYNLISYNSDTSANTTYGYGAGQLTDQTSLVRCMLPKGGAAANYFEYGYMSIQYEQSSTMVVTLNGSTYIMSGRLYLKDS